MKIDKVIISGFHKITDPIEYRLDNCNIIYGPNGSGKTTIMEAIQWVLLGYIPSTGKTKSSIFEHANDTNMYAEIIFDDGTRISRRLSQTDFKSDIVVDNNVPKDFDVFGNLSLPIMEYSEFIGMTANKLKSWFTDILPEHVIKINWSDELLSVVPKTLNDSRTTELLSDILMNIPYLEDQDKPTTIDDIKAVNDTVKEYLKFNKNELSQMESTIKTLVYYSDISSDTDIESLKSELKEIENSIHSYERAKDIIAQNELAQKTIASITATQDDVDNMHNSVNTFNEKLQATVHQGSQMKETVALKTAELNTLKEILDGKGICPYTNKSCDTIADELKQFKRKYDALVAEIEDLNSQITDARNDYTAVHNEMEAVLSRLNYAEQQLAKKIDLEGQIVEVTSIPDEELEALRNKAEEIRDIIIKLEANLKYEKAIDEFNLEKQKVSYNIDILKLWDKHTDVNGLQSKMLIDGNQFDLLSKTMDDIGIIPEKVNFDVGGKNTFSFGIIRNNKYIKYAGLSSGEKCLFSITLLIALLKLSDIPLKLILIDDILDHLDSTNLKKIIDYIANNQEVQVVFAGVFDNIPNDINNVNLLHIQ